MTQASADLALWVHDETVITSSDMADKWITLYFDYTKLVFFTSPENIKRIIDILLMALEKRQAEEDDADSE